MKLFKSGNICGIIDRGARIIKVYGLQSDNTRRITSQF